MDIWQWVSETLTDLQESGQERLATIVNRLPQAALAHRYEEADALAYEGLGLARSLGAPWIQVFIRHWHLQARVANRGEGASPLAEAVSALEAAHRDETRDCPQAVCTVQDLAICYSRTDGVGWAPERLAVAEEALASINPSWPCFACITSEKATALNDLGRPEEALSALDAARAAMSYDQSEFVTIIARLETMIALRRWDDALRAADRFRPQQDEGSEQRELQVLVRRAFALASSGCTTDAASCLPGADKIAPADMRWWARTAELTAADGAMDNDWQLGSQLQAMVAELEELGSWRDAVEVALIHGRLAVRRGRRYVARRAARTAERLAAELRQPRTVAADLTALAHDAEGLSPSGVLPATSQELLARMEEDLGP